MYSGAAGLAGLADEGAIVSAHEPSTFHARVTTLDLVTIRVRRIEASAHRSVLQPAGDGAQRADGIRFLFVANGDVHTTVGGRRTPDAEGGARILLPSTPAEYDAAGPSVILMVEAPVTTVPALIGALLADRSADPIRPGALPAATIAFIDGALDLPVEPRSDDVHHLERALAGLLTATAAEARGGSPDLEPTPSERPLDELVFERAMGLIRLELADPELALPQIARRLGTSSRSLQRVFAKHGVSVSEAVRDARLDALAASLTDAESTRPLGAATRAVGFGAVDYARRAFLKRFGVSMTRYRAGERRPEPITDR